MNIPLLSALAVLLAAPSGAETWDQGPAAALLVAQAKAVGAEAPGAVIVEARNRSLLSPEAGYKKAGDDLIKACGEKQPSAALDGPSTIYNLSGFIHGIQLCRVAPEEPATGYVLLESSEWASGSRAAAHQGHLLNLEARCRQLHPTASLIGAPLMTDDDDVPRTFAVCRFKKAL